MDFGTNPAATGAQRKKKEEENYGIVTVELPNGQKLDGYILLSEKNLAKLGLTTQQAKDFGQVSKSVSNAKLHVQFGDRVVKVAEPVAFDA